MDKQPDFTRSECPYSHVNPKQASKIAGGRRSMQAEGLWMTDERRRGPRMDLVGKAPLSALGEALLGRKREKDDA